MGSRKAIKVYIRIAFAMVAGFSSFAAMAILGQLFVVRVGTHIVVVFLFWGLSAALAGLLAGLIASEKGGYYGNVATAIIIFGVASGYSRELPQPSIGFAIGLVMLVTAHLGGVLGEKFAQLIFRKLA